MLIAVDAGHGSNTAGKRTPDGYREHWINVRTASYFTKAMNRCNANTVKIAWDDGDAKDDDDIKLVARQKLVRDSKATISVSFHANAHGSGSEWTTGQGVETLIHTDNLKANDSLKLANLVQAELIKGTEQKNRGVKRMELAMCNCVAMKTKASILIEIGFMTNKYEAELMKTEAFCKECAEETARGVCKYLGIEYVGEEMSDKNLNEGSEWSKLDREWGINQGLIVGDGEGNYGWKEPVTKEQLIAILHRFAKTQ